MQPTSATLAHVVNQTPINLNQFTSLVDIFQKSCERFAKRPAYTNMGQTMSYAELDEKTRLFATYLQKKCGFKKGDRLALMMPNLLQFPVIFFGTLRAGGIVVNVNPMYTPRELKHQLNDSGATAIVILENFAHVLAHVVDETSLKHIILTEIGDFLPPLKAGLINFTVKHVKHMVPNFKLDQVVHLRQMMKEAKKYSLDPVKIDYDDIALLQYTGGTTGIAKGAMLTHRNLVANILQLEWCLDIEEGKEVIITALPLYHIFALMVNCLLFIKAGGLSVLITNPRDMSAFVKEISKHVYTVFTGVNTLFNGLLNNKEFAELDFSHLKVAIGGGMAVQAAVAQRWFEITGCRLFMGYGLTETSPVVALEPSSEKKFTGTIGLPIASTEISIQNDQGEIVDRNIVGELCIRGPQVMKGYWQRREETDGVLLPNGWLRTGDLGLIQDNDYIKIVDRKKDMVLVSGFNVYPNEIEDVLAAMPGVQEVACIGVPDKHSGEAVKVFIVRKPGATVEKVDVRKYSKENLTGYKIPRYVEFRESLPKTAVGKIMRRELREQEQANPMNDLDDTADPMD